MNKIKREQAKISGSTVSGAASSGVENSEAAPVELPMLPTTAHKHEQQQPQPIVVVDVDPDNAEPLPPAGGDAASQQQQPAGGDAASQQQQPAGGDAASQQQPPAGGNAALPQPQPDANAALPQPQPDANAALPQPQPDANVNPLQEPVSDGDETSTSVSDGDETSTSDGSLQYYSPNEEPTAAHSPLTIRGVLRPVLFVPGTKHFWPPLSAPKIRNQRAAVCASIPKKPVLTVPPDTGAEASRVTIGGLEQAVFLQAETTLMEKDIDAEKIGSIDEDHVDAVILNGAHTTRHLHPVLSYFLLKAATKFAPNLSPAEYAYQVIFALFLPCFGRTKQSEQITLNVTLWNHFYPFVSQCVFLAGTVESTQLWARVTMVVILNKLYQAQLSLTNRSPDTLEQLDLLAERLFIDEQWNAAKSKPPSRQPKKREQGHPVDESDVDVGLLIERAQHMCADDGRGSVLYFRALTESTYVQFETYMAALLNEQNSRLRATQVHDVPNKDADTVMLTNFVNCFNQVPIRSEIQNYELRGDLGNYKSAKFDVWMQSIENIIGIAAATDTEIKLWCRYWQLLLATRCVPHHSEEDFSFSRPADANKWQVMEVYLDVLVHGMDRSVLADASGEFAPNTLYVTFAGNALPKKQGRKKTNAKAGTDFIAILPWVDNALDKANANTAVRVIFQNLLNVVNLLVDNKANMCYPACSSGRTSNALRIMRPLRTQQHMGWVTFGKCPPTSKYLPLLTMNKRQHSTDRMLLAELEANVLENKIQDVEEYMRASAAIRDQLPPAVARCTVFLLTPKDDKDDYKVYTAECVIYNMQRLAYEAAPTDAIKRGFQTEPARRFPVQDGAWAIASKAGKKSGSSAYAGLDVTVFEAIGTSVLNNKENYAIIARTQTVKVDELFLRVPDQQPVRNNKVFEATLFWERQLTLFFEETVPFIQDPYPEVFLSVFRNFPDKRSDGKFRVSDIVFYAMKGTEFWGGQLSMQDVVSPVHALDVAFQMCGALENNQDLEATKTRMQKSMLRLLVAAVLCECETSRYNIIESRVHKIDMVWRVAIGMFLQMPTRITPPSELEPVGTWWFNCARLSTHDDVLTAMREFMMSFSFEVARHCVGTMCNWAVDITRPPAELLGTPVLPISGMKMIVGHAFYRYNIVPMRGAPAAVQLTGIKIDNRERLPAIRSHLNVINAKNTLEYMLTRCRLFGPARDPRNKKEMQQVRKIDRRDTAPYMELFKQPMEKLRKIRSGPAEARNTYAAWNTAFFYMPTPMQSFVEHVKTMHGEGDKKTFPSDAVRGAVQLLASLEFREAKLEDLCVPTLFVCMDAQTARAADDAYNRAAHVLEAAVAAVPTDELNRLARLVETTMDSMEPRIVQSSAIRTGNTDVMLAGAVAAFVEHTVCAHGHQLVAVVQNRNRAVAYRDAMDLVVRNIGLQFSIRALAARALDMCVSTDVLSVLVGGIALCLAGFFKAQVPDDDDDAKLEALLRHVGMDRDSGFDYNKPVSLDVWNSTFQINDAVAATIARIVYEPACVVAGRMRIHDEQRATFIDKVYAKVLLDVTKYPKMNENVSSALDAFNSPDEVWVRFMRFAEKNPIALVHIDTLVTSTPLTLFDNRTTIDTVEKLRVAFDAKLYKSVQSAEGVFAGAVADHALLREITTKFIAYAAGRLRRMEILKDDVSNAAWIDCVGNRLTMLSEIVEAERTDPSAGEYAYGQRLSRQLSSILTANGSTNECYPSAWAAYWKNASHVLDFVHAVATPAQRVIAGAPQSGDAQPAQLLSESDIWSTIVSLFTPPPAARRKTGKHDAQTTVQSVMYVEGYRPTRVESQNGQVIDLINEAKTIHKFRMWFIGMKPAQWFHSWVSGKWQDEHAFDLYRHGIPITKIFRRTSPSELVELFRILSTWKKTDDSNFHASFNALGIYNDVRNWDAALEERIEKLKKHYRRRGGYQEYAFLVPVARGEKRLWTYIGVSIPTTVLLRAPLLFHAEARAQDVVLKIADKYDDNGGGENAAFNQSIMTAFSNAKSTIHEMIKQLAPKGFLPPGWQVPDPQRVRYHGKLRETARNAYIHFLGASAGVFAQDSETSGVQLQFAPGADNFAHLVDRVNRPRSKDLIARQMEYKRNQSSVDPPLGSSTETPAALDEQAVFAMQRDLLAASAEMKRLGKDAAATASTKPKASTAGNGATKSSKINSDDDDDDDATDTASSSASDSDEADVSKVVAALAAAQQKETTAQALAATQQTGTKLPKIWLDLTSQMQ
jgi:hypothetical protein